MRGLSPGRDRAVSEVIAFVLVFGIVVASIGLLYTVGFGSLGQLQESEQDDSAQRAMHAVAVAFDDIQAGRGTSRVATMDLRGRTLAVDDDVDLDVEITQEVTGNLVTSESAGGALVYGRGTGTELAYQSGALIRSQGEDAQLVQRAPRFRCTADHAVVSLVDVSQEGEGAVSSGGSVDLDAEQVDARGERLAGVASGSGPYVVTVDFSGRYETAWRRYFEDDTNQWTVTGTGTAECQGVDEAYVLHTGIEIQFLT